MTTGDRAGPRVPRWALPGGLAAAGEGRVTRTARDWSVDVVLFGFALWWWWQAGGRNLNAGTDPDYLAAVPDWMLAVDPWVGLLACGALWWRRRFPLALAVAMVPALAVSGTATGAVLVSIFTVAVHRSWPAATLVTAVQTTQAAGFSLLWQPPELPGRIFTVYVLLMFTVPLGWGLVVRFRRQLLLSLRRDAERERREHRRRLAEAKRTERERIAREMHDVLAHRISLLSVHAGALAYRTGRAEDGAGPPLTPAELAASGHLIQDNAQLALTELGEVLTVLRAGDGGGPAADPPQPLLADVPRLVAEARAAGQQVALDVDPDLLAAPPRTQEQRTVYRVVQEGLTNARKHSPGAPVAVRVAGGPATGVVVAVTNPVPADRPAAPPAAGSGTGLAGLAERVALDGGTLTHGPAAGGFRLAAELPWHR